MRQPAVADRFYPGSPKALTKIVQSLFSENPGEGKVKAHAIVSPHAGYIYSGSLAAKTIDSVTVPRNVVILGPNHHGQGARAALSLDDWEMPHGVVLNNTRLCKLILHHSEMIENDEVAHRFEHSLEVQIPLLQFVQNHLTIAPLTVSHLSFETCQKIALSLGQAIEKYGEDVLLVASSDMSHYESRTVTEEKDGKALRAILDLDPKGLYKTVHENRISMCGVVPVVISILTAKFLGATSAIELGYTDSGYVSGDTDQVVGYAGIAIV